MPRKSRIDAPGALHHGIARGINRQRIFLEDPAIFFNTDTSPFYYCATGELRISMTTLSA
jgi:hypothetical protein